VITKVTTMYFVSSKFLDFDLKHPPPHKRLGHTVPREVQDNWIRIIGIENLWAWRLDDYGLLL